MLSRISIKYLFILAGIVALFILPESLFFDDNLSVCIFKNITGKECPLCGMTRSIWQLLRFHPVLAFNYNPLIAFFPVLLITEIINDTVPHGFARLRKILWILFGAGFILLFIIRLF
jgi:hypothetical protein